MIRAHQSAAHVRNDETQKADGTTHADRRSRKQRTEKDQDPLRGRYRNPQSARRLLAKGKRVQGTMLRGQIKRADCHDQAGQGKRFPLCAGQTSRKPEIHAVHRKCVRGGDGDPTRQGVHHHRYHDPGKQHPRHLHSAVDARHPVNEDDADQRAEKGAERKREFPPKGKDAEDQNIEANALAPEDTPKTNGSARRLRISVCIATPHTLKDAPTTMPSSTRGTRIRQSMLISKCEGSPNQARIPRNAPEKDPRNRGGRVACRAQADGEKNARCEKERAQKHPGFKGKAFAHVFPSGTYLRKKTVDQGRASARSRLHDRHCLALLKHISSGHSARAHCFYNAGELIVSCRGRDVKRSSISGSRVEKIFFRALDNPILEVYTDTQNGERSGAL